MKKTKKINQDLGIEYQDCGPWRSYQLTADGSTFDELMGAAYIEEVDQDGGTLDHYPVRGCGNSKITLATYKLVYKILGLDWNVDQKIKDDQIEQMYDSDLDFEERTDPGRTHTDIGR